MKIILSLIACLALSGPAAVLAKDAAAELTPEHFAALNGKGSGGVSQQEYEQFIRDAFKKLDSDGSNSLSREETAKVLSPEQFSAIDKNKDNEVTLDELIQQITRDYERYDRK